MSLAKCRAAPPRIRISLGRNHGRGIPQQKCRIDQDLGSLASNRRKTLRQNTCGFQFDREEPRRIRVDRKARPSVCSRFSQVMACPTAPPMKLPHACAVTNRLSFVIGYRFVHRKALKGAKYGLCTGIEIDDCLFDLRPHFFFPW